ncbi:MAG: helix-turn-helix transcriptional regulator, partial [Peptostreptococcaceae bacterium]|nr:helix-turn-helix transcriptional regulator [Peptostreptococcaceae bacterium]
MNIGENIRKIRELKNISQDKLSKLSNMPRTSLGRYERNERTPNIDTLNKIANALKVDIDALLYWSNNILICEDVLKFISNLYPDKYYEFGEKLELLGYM